MNGRVVHFEVPFDDGARAKGFYRDVFGWTYHEMADFGYTGVATGPTGEDGMPSEPGFIGGGMFQRQAPVEVPVITLDVEDIDATLEQVTAHGGSVVDGKMAIGDMGFAAYFRDSEGNLMGLWQNAG